MKVFLILLYIWKGEITFQKKLFPGDLEACAAAGMQLVKALADDPRLDEILYGHCIELPAMEANK